MPSTAAILVNWRQPDLTLAAVDSLARQTVPVSAIVVDNGSGDGSAERLREAASGKGFQFIASAENLGFGGGCNIGIDVARQSGFDTIWLLNNDATPAPNCLEHMLARLDAAGGRAIVGSRIVDPEGNARDHSGGIMGPWTLTGRVALAEADYEGMTYGWITGASLLAPLRLFDEVGMFDPHYFMYWEDADLALRARRLGYPLTVARDARVEHSAGTSSNDTPVLRYMWHFRAQRRFLSKHHQHPALARRLLGVKYVAKSLLDRDFRRLAMVLGEVLHPPDLSAGRQP